MLPPPVAAAFVAPLKPRRASDCSGGPSSLRDRHATSRGRRSRTTLLSVVTSQAASARLVVRQWMTDFCSDRGGLAVCHSRARQIYRAILAAYQPHITAGVVLAERYPGSATRSIASCATWASRRWLTSSPPRGRRCCSASGSAAATSCTSPAEPRCPALSHRWQHSPPLDAGGDTRRLSRAAFAHSIVMELFRLRHPLDTYINYTLTSHDPVSVGSGGLYNPHDLNLPATAPA